MRESLSSTRFLVRVAWTQSPRDAVAAFLEVAGLVLQRLMPIWVALLLGGVGAENLRLTTIGAIGAALSLGAAGLFIVWGVNSRLRLLDLVGHTLDRDLAGAMGSTATLVEFSQPSVRETLQIIKDRLGALGGAYNALINALNGSVPPIASVVAAGVIDPRLALLALVGLLSIPHAWLSIRWEESAEDASAESGTESQAWVDTLLGDEAEELEAYGSSVSFGEEAVGATERWRVPIARAERRANTIGIAYDIVYAAAASLIVGWVVSTTQGWKAGAVLVAGLLIAVDLREGFEGLRGSVQAFAQGLRTVTRYRQALALLRYSSETGPVECEGRSGVSAFASGPIRLEGVSVKYPGNEHQALSDVTVDIAPGTIVALVGENGAGKSTFVHALLGLYPPCAGEISVGGTAVDARTSMSWRGAASGVFQEHVRFGFSVGESVGIGDLLGRSGGPGEPARGSAVVTALRDADAEVLVDSLPDGLQTLLGDDGHELSGGEWQRLSLARGMVKDAPSLLVLDEPTSALDPYSERRMLDHNLAQGRLVADGRGITLIVTHRLSSVTSADLVLMLEKGRLVEHGTHDELMRADGPYRELFDLYSRDFH